MFCGQMDGCTLFEGSPPATWGERGSLPPVPLSALAIAHYDSGTVGYSNGTLTGARCDSRLFVAFREDLHTISKEALRSLFTV